MPGIRTRRMRVSGTIVLAGAIMACQPQPHVETAKPSRGPWFAQEYTCPACHAIERGGVSRDPKAPSFVAIVNREGVTAEALASSIPDVHTHLEPEQYPVNMIIPQPMLDELVTYMLTLQDPKYRSPS